jgi:hypothetical protein
VWQIVVANTALGIEWWSWNLDTLCRKVSDLHSGQRLHAAGYPELEDNFDIEKFDIEKFDIDEHPFIAFGQLTDKPLTDDVYSIKLDQHLPTVDLNGVSGGPVFARFGEKFHFVGISIRGGVDHYRGTPPYIHFISSEKLIGLLDHLIEGSDRVA